MSSLNCGGVRFVIVFVHVNTEKFVRPGLATLSLPLLEPLHPLQFYGSYGCYEMG